MTPYTQTLDTLCQLLETGDEADRCYAARALGTFKDAAAVDKLVECLRDEDLDVVIDAAEALGKIGSDKALPALLESLQNDPSGEVCSMIARALGQIGSPDAIDALLGMATERPEYLEWDDDWDTWWDVQRESIKALGCLRAEQAIDMLTGLIDDESQQDIEPDILNTLISISPAGETKVIERLLNQNHPPLNRRRAATTLARAPGKEATRALGRALTDPAPDVRAAAALALARKNAPAYMSALILLLRDPEKEVRQAAVKSITRLAQQNRRLEEAQQAFQSMLADPDSQVRATLFDILLPAVADNPLSAENFKTVVESTRDDSAEAAAAACSLLGANGDAAALPRLIEIVADEKANPMVRRDAATAIGALGVIDSQVLSTLETVVGDKQQAVRLAALSALMELEKNGHPAADEADMSLPSPLQIIIAALRGEITPVEDSSPASVEVTLNTEVDQAGTGADDAAVPSGSETGTGGSEAQDDSSTAAAEEPDLPETPAEIITEGDAQPVMSTLDAIAKANVESMLATPHPEKDIQDEITREYLDIVEDNKEIMKRMRSGSSRRIKAHQDIRRLAARVLADARQPEAVNILVEALNDDDMLVRREAAEAIGIMAKEQLDYPELMNAMGTLMTQLALSDLDQKIIAARTLSYLGNRAALAPLMESTSAAESTLRIAAIDSLVHLSLNSRDPAEADHMVVRDIPPLSVARKLLEKLEDQDIGVRIAAARGLGRILEPLDEENFTRKVMEKVISSITLGTGEEARLVGRALCHFNTELANELLLDNLRQADDSVKRSVFIEMIEEIFSGQTASDQAA
jgi:HEAT repeat protein